MYYIRGILYCEKILENQGEGKGQCEMAESWGLRGDRPVHDLLKRETKEIQGMHKPQGCKPVKTLEKLQAR